MIFAYSELYLEHARNVLAVSMDYAINCLGFDPDEWYAIFAGHLQRDNLKREIRNM